jgi:hypothetical protein
MISDSDHPRMIAAQKELLRRLGVALGDGTNPLTTGFLHDLFEIVKHHRAECRREKNLDFPTMVALVVPRLGIVEFKRADLDIASLRQLVVNFVRFNPQVTPEETVAAFRHAYPDLRAGDILEPRNTAELADDRAIERSQRIGEEAQKIVKEQDE